MSEHDYDNDNDKQQRRWRDIRTASLGYFGCIPFVGCRTSRKGSPAYASAQAGFIRGGSQHECSTAATPMTG
jgi:hypothetical protein